MGCKEKKQLPKIYSLMVALPPVGYMVN
jgi:hypothetical protein